VALDPTFHGSTVNFCWRIPFQVTMGTLVVAVRRNLNFMVEKPIKRSERPAASDATEQSEGDAPRASRGDRNNRRSKGKGSGRGKGRGDRQDAPPPVPPAFVRGPKPKPKVEEPEPAPEEVAVEASGEEVTEETTSEVSEDTAETP
jgi:hypothetical protein